MSIESINEPGSSRLVSHTPISINEPPSWEMPTITALNPSGAAIGDPSFTLTVSGSGFMENYSLINFAGHDEPTTHEEDGSLSTGINMEMWQAPDTVQVKVVNGPLASDPLDFTFSAPGTRATHGHLVDPDELEEELEEAREDHEFEPTHKSHKKRRK